MSSIRGAGDQRTIRFAGHGLDDNNLTLDGVDATAVFNQMQHEYVRLTIPLGSIDQFDVKDQTFGADVEGGTAGAQVAVVSRSGTNSFHGNIFDYFRNEAFEARTPFSGPSPNPFLLNQFGTAAGRADFAQQAVLLRRLERFLANGWTELKSEWCLARSSSPRGGARLAIAVIPESRVLTADPSPSEPATLA